MLAQSLASAEGRQRDGYFRDALDIAWGSYRPRDASCRGKTLLAELLAAVGDNQRSEELCTAVLEDRDCEELYKSRCSSSPWQKCSR